MRKARSEASKEIQIFDEESKRANSQKITDVLIR